MTATSFSTVSTHVHSNLAPTEATARTPHAPATGEPTVFIDPPPPLSAVPDAPAPSPSPLRHDHVASLPKNVELEAMPEALDELAHFDDYASLFGQTAPPLELVLRAATAAGGWSAMRAKAAAWERYARTQEAASWSAFRAVMSSVRPALALAVRAEPSVAQKVPGLVRLFGAKSVIAQHGVITRAANRAAKGEGEPPARGVRATQAKRVKSAAGTLAAAGESVVGATRGARVQSAAAGVDASNGEGAAGAPLPVRAPASPHSD